MVKLLLQNILNRSRLRGYHFHYWWTHLFTQVTGNQYLATGNFKRMLQPSNI